MAIKLLSPESERKFLVFSLLISMILTGCSTAGAESRTNVLVVKPTDTHGIEGDPIKIKPEANGGIFVAGMTAERAIQIINDSKILETFSQSNMDGAGRAYEDLLSQILNSKTLDKIYTALQKKLAKGNPKGNINPAKYAKALKAILESIKNEGTLPTIIVIPVWGEDLNEDGQLDCLHFPVDTCSEEGTIISKLPPQPQPQPQIEKN